MIPSMTLTQSVQGEPVQILQLHNEGSDRRRLMDLGFTPGAKITRLQTSPLGDPIAFEVRGSVIALRQDQCDQVEVKPC